MNTVIVWFRNDLRLHDARVLHAALARRPDRLLPVVLHPPTDTVTRWDFPRVGQHRQHWRRAAVRALATQLSALGCPLLECTSSPAEVLPALARAVGADSVWCEAHAAPEEGDEEAALRAAGLDLQVVWQGSLLAPEHLPWPVARLPAHFTAFRQAVEAAGLEPAAALPAPMALPPWPEAARDLHPAAPAPLTEQPANDPRSAFPYAEPAFDGGEPAARAHLAQYLARRLPHTYKATRNALQGIDSSSKFSPWLATGALSPRWIMAELRRFEAKAGANESSYWLWFELLWRDYFRFLHLQHGRRLYRARGLADQPLPPQNADAFAGWCASETGEPLVDAGMRELAATGYLSNRMRQIVASYLIHDLGGDWRAGAAWFEAQLIDYDVYSNHGNWLYIAGRGTDPRGGRRFNPAKQAETYDPDGYYRRQWGSLP